MHWSAYLVLSKCIFLLDVQRFLFECVYVLYALAFFYIIAGLLSHIQGEMMLESWWLPMWLSQLLSCSLWSHVEPFRAHLARHLWPVSDHVYAKCTPAHVTDNLTKNARAMFSYSNGDRDATSGPYCKKCLEKIGEHFPAPALGNRQRVKNEYDAWSPGASDGLARVGNMYNSWTLT